jgi:hypothetical protein
MKLNNHGNWTLIGLLVTLVIIVAAVAVIYGNGGGLTTVKKDSPLLDQSSTKKTVLGKALDTSKSAVCRSQLDQLRAGIESYKTTSTDGSLPKTLKDIGLGVSNTFYQCPVSDKPYVYDPATGRVMCPTHPTF